MFISDWLCPDCGNNLYVTNSGRYWCGTCNAEKDADIVDPLYRDFVRNQVILQIALEYALQEGVTL